VIRAGFLCKEFAAVRQILAIERTLVLFNPDRFNLTQKVVITRRDRVHANTDPILRPRTSETIPGSLIMTKRKEMETMHVLTKTRRDAAKSFASVRFVTNNANKSVDRRLRVRIGAKHTWFSRFDDSVRDVTETNMRFELG